MKRITKLVLEDTRRKTSGEAAASRPGGMITAAGASAIQDAMLASGPVSQLAAGHRAEGGDQWDTGRHGSGAVVAESIAPVVTGPVPANSPAAKAAVMQSQPVRVPTAHSAPASVIAAQRSTRVRRRNRSLFDRLFGWLLGR